MNVRTTFCLKGREPIFLKLHLSHVNEPDFVQLVGQKIFMFDVYLCVFGEMNVRLAESIMPLLIC